MSISVVLKYVVGAFLPLLGALHIWGCERSVVARQPHEDRGQLLPLSSPEEEHNSEQRFSSDVQRIFSLKYAPALFLYMLTIFFSVAPEEKGSAKDIFLLVCFVVSGVYMLYDALADPRGIHKVHYLMLSAGLFYEYIVISTGVGHILQKHVVILLYGFGFSSALLSTMYYGICFLKWDRSGNFHFIKHLLGVCLLYNGFILMAVGLFEARSSLPA